LSAKVGHLADRDDLVPLGSKMRGEVAILPGEIPVNE